MLDGASKNKYFVEITKEIEDSLNSKNAQDLRMGILDKCDNNLSVGARVLCLVR